MRSWIWFMVAMVVVVLYQDTAKACDRPLLARRAVARVVELDRRIATVPFRLFERARQSSARCSAATSVSCVAQQGAPPPPQPMPVPPPAVKKTEPTKK